MMETLSISWCLRAFKLPEMSSKTILMCLVCRKCPKRMTTQFCSKGCTNIAARKAPQLFRVPSNHVMYKDVAKSFSTTWNSNTRCPAIARMYLITWTKRLRSSFDKYCQHVGKEVKRFRSEARMCHLGNLGKPMRLCKRKQCHLCHAIATGFRSTLNYKRLLLRWGDLCRNRFGAGIYMAPASSMAFIYADNTNMGSQYKAVLSARMVLGNPQKVDHNNRRRFKPDPGYNSLKAHPQGQGLTELVVYNYNAARPAYLLILK
ncbi:hypothetical protein EDD18DRAFT_1165904 [Armillaria luteobubalina]|uniref:PARP catalytic domain-containing protein n=1 Tax=Armillaria luteobubalina TaxID=153913 RepID=A0AA39UWX4_9AGAR|nr:hypothetical protein EDD18DRAFT_1165904 [Armillaria luteobubalina]